MLTQATSLVSGFLALVGIIVALVAAYLMHKLLHFKHGLGEARNYTRYDLLGEVATRPEEPGFLETILNVTNSPLFAAKFRAFVFGHVGASSLVEFGTTMLAKVDTEFQGHADPLKRGDLRAVAQKRWPAWKDEDGTLQGQFEMHERVPEDVSLSLLDHDQLISGDDPTLLSYRAVTCSDLKRAYAASLVRVEELASYIPAICIMLGLAVMVVAVPLIAAMVGSTVAGAVLGVFSGMALAAGSAMLLVNSLAKSALHARSVSAFAQHKVNEDIILRTATVARVRNVNEARSPGEGLVAYRNALRSMLKDRTPSIQLGVAEGHALLHGVSPTNCYQEGQSVRLTIGDLTMGGVLILGATGSGKSFSIIIPLMAQVMRSPFETSEIEEAQAGGYRLTASMVTFDPKAALHHDAAALAADCGWFSRNVGTGEGEFGIDLFDGLSAVIVSTILSEAVSQKGGGGQSKDPFWGSMAAKIRYSAAVIARVYELTDKGIEEVEKTGERIYSPVGIYKLAMACRTADGVLFKVIETIIRNGRDQALRRFIMPLCGPELIAAIDFLRRDVLTLFSETTVGGFLANVSDSLADFVAEADIRERFGAARGNILPMDKLWDHKTVTNFRLSKYTYGDVAAVITVMAKIRLYHWSAVRHETKPKLAKMSKMVVVIDECQELVTKGGTFSEAQFINMSRAMSMSFILATQTVSALVEAMGSEKAVYNMLAQLRSKVFLGSEDIDTLAYLQRITGTTYQSVRSSKPDSKLLWRKLETGSTLFKTEADDTTDEDMLLMTHPLVHGRVEPHQMGQKHVQGIGLEQKEELNGVRPYSTRYEEMFLEEEGEGAVAAMVQGRMTSLLGRAPSKAPLNDKGVEDMRLELLPVYDNLRLAIGGAIVVANRGSLMRHDRVRLTHHLGFLTNSGKVIVNKEALKDPEMVAAIAASTPERVKALRDANVASSDALIAKQDADKADKAGKALVPVKA